MPIFLAVIGSAFTSREYLAASGQFLLYTFGMSVVVVGATFAIAVFRESLATRARRAMRYVQPVGATLVLMASGYVTCYWLTLGGLLSVIGLLATIKL